MWCLPLIVLGAVVAGGAQEGHPLTGTWSGDWGEGPADREHLTLVMRWDGERVSGVINPGPRSVPIGTVQLDVADWGVRLRATATGAGGVPVEITAEGRIEELESWHRRIVGTWSQDGREGEFLLTRD
jgi:hypothetical protein